MRAIAADQKRAADLKLRAVFIEVLHRTSSPRAQALWWTDNSPMIQRPSGSLVVWEERIFEIHASRLSAPKKGRKSACHRCKPVGTWHLECPKAPGGGDTLRCQRMLRDLGCLIRAFCRPLRGLKDQNILGAAFHPLTRMARRLSPPLGVETNALIPLAQCPTKADSLFIMGSQRRFRSSSPGKGDRRFGHRRSRGLSSLTGLFGRTDTRTP